MLFNFIYCFMLNFVKFLFDMVVRMLEINCLNKILVY